MPSPVNAGTWLAAAERTLRAAGIETEPRREARLLLAHATGFSQARLLAEPRSLLDEEALARANALLERRARREPLAYVVGRVEWRELSLRVDSRCLVPRPETETLVDWALGCLDPRAEAWLIDVGVGSGCLLASVLRERPRVRGIGIDVSADALTIARENLVANVPDRNCHLLRSRSLTGVRPVGAPVVVLANPPYVTECEWRLTEPEVRDHEPRVALVVPDDDPLAPYQTLLEDVTRWEERPLLGFEVGAGRASAVLELVRRAGLRDASILRDFTGVERFVVSPGDPERGDRFATRSGSLSGL